VACDGRCWMSWSLKKCSIIYAQTERLGWRAGAGSMGANPTRLSLGNSRPVIASDILCFFGVLPPKSVFFFPTHLGLYHEKKSSRGSTFFRLNEENS
jgi:hypothetical protein